MIVEHSTHDYPIAVVEGDVKAGRLVQKACERHMRDLESARDRGLWFDPKAADVALDFFSLLRFTKGRWGGSQFMLEPWQRFMIGATFGWKRHNGARRFRNLHLEIARKNGKTETAAGTALKLLSMDRESGAEVYCLAPLALSTEVATSHGWTTMGEVKVGETVFDEKGKPCKVVGLSPVYQDRECYEVKFSDGTKVVTDADHLWTVNSIWNGRASKSGIPRGTSTRSNQTISTKGMIEKLRTPFGLANYYIPAVIDLESPEVDLPISPYTLGAWLGDGRSNRGCLVHHQDDKAIRESIESEGWETRQHGHGDRLLRYTVLGLRTKLRSHGLLDNKHVPDVYFRASSSQRLELLRGLLDTDGTCTKSGEIRFTNRNELLSRAVYELASSLGVIPNFREIQVEGTPHFVVSFRGNNHDYFRLGRKSARQVRAQRQASNRRIVDIVPVDSVPVRCIAVDSESHLFLISRGLIATHNTKRDQAKLTFDVAKQMVAKSPSLNRHLRRLKNTVYHEHSGSSLQPLGADADSLDGLNVHGSIKDELHAWKSRDLWDVIDTASGARDQPLSVVTTTAGFNRNSIWWERRELGVKLLEGVEGYEDDEFFPLIFTLDEEDDWTSPDVWHKGNPNLGVTIRFEELEARCNDAKKTPGLINAFRRLRLNQPTESVTKWLNLGLLKSAWDEYPEDLLVNRVCFGGLDLSQTLDLTAWALIFPPSADDPNWRLLVRHFLPSHEVEDREHRDGFRYQSVADGNRLTLTEGNWVDYETVKARILADRDKFNLVSLAYDRRFAPAIIQELVKEGIECVPWSQTFGGLNTGTKEFKRLLTARSIRFPKCPLFEWETENTVVEIDAAGNERPHKGKSTHRIDGVVAAINALSLASFKFGSEQVEAGVEEVDIGNFNVFEGTW